MKHKEEGYRLFHDDHVRMVGFQPGFATDSHCLFRSIVKPFLGSLGAIPLLLLLARSQVTFLVHSIIAKPELVDVVYMLLHCYIAFSTT